MICGGGDGGGRGDDDNSTMIHRSKMMIMDVESTLTRQCLYRNPRAILTLTLILS